MIGQYEGEIPSKTPCASCGRRINPLSEAVVSQNGLWFCNTVEMMEYSRPIVPRFDKAPLPWTEKISMGVVITVMVGLLVFLWSLPARSHSMEHPEYNAELQQLTDGEGHSCCDNGDMKLIHRTEDWKMEGGRYWVRLFDQWVEVPDVAVHMNARVPEQVTEGKAVVWYRVNPHVEGGEMVFDRIHIYCFQAGLQA